MKKNAKYLIMPIILTMFFISISKVGAAFRICSIDEIRGGIPYHKMYGCNSKGYLVEDYNGEYRTANEEITDDYYEPIYEDKTPVIYFCTQWQYGTPIFQAYKSYVGPNKSNPRKEDIKIEKSENTYEKCLNDLINYDAYYEEKEKLLNGSLSADLDKDKDKETIKSKHLPGEVTIPDYCRAGVGVLTEYYHEASSSRDYSQTYEDYSTTSKAITTFMRNVCGYHSEYNGNERNSYYDDIALGNIDNKVSKYYQFAKYISGLYQVINDKSLLINKSKDEIVIDEYNMEIKDDDDSILYSSVELSFNNTLLKEVEEKVNHIKTILQGNTTIGNAELSKKNTFGNVVCKVVNPDKTQSTDKKMQISLDGINYTTSLSIGIDGNTINPSGKTDTFNETLYIKSVFGSDKKIECSIEHDFWIADKYNRGCGKDWFKNTKDEPGTLPQNWTPTQDVVSSVRSKKTQKDTKRIRLKNCNDYLNEIDLNSPDAKEKLVDLYEKYLNKHKNYSNLLNFEEPSCSYSKENVKTSCMNTSYGVNDAYETLFNENNWSNYTEKRTLNVNGEINTAYCFSSYYLKKTGNYSPKEVKGGQLYFDTRDNNIMDGKLKYECYSLGDISSSVLPLRVNEYFSSPIQMIKGERVYQINVTGEDTDIKQDSSTNKHHISGTINLNTTFEPVYASLDGKISNKDCLGSSCRLLGYGIPSPLYDPNYKTEEKVLDNGETISYNDEYTFVVNLDDTHFKDVQNVNQNYFSTLDRTASCYYSYKPQIVDDKEQLQLEFREIDTKNPFVNIDGQKRNTMTNWCYGNEKFKVYEIEEELRSRGMDPLSVTLATRLNSIIETGLIDEHTKADLDNTFWTSDMDGLYELIDLYRDGTLNVVDVALFSRYLAFLNNNLDKPSCSSGNIVVNKVIKQSPNSYGLVGNTKSEPKYKITLTPSLMNEISNFEYEPGKKLKYTDLILNCKDYAGNNCTDKTIYRKYTSKLLDELVSKEEQQEGSGLKITNSSKR